MVGQNQCLEMDRASSLVVFIYMDDYFARGNFEQKCEKNMNDDI